MKVKMNQRTKKFTRNLEEFSCFRATWLHVQKLQKVLIKWILQPPQLEIFFKKFTRRHMENLACFGATWLYLRKLQEKVLIKWILQPTSFLV